MTVGLRKKKILAASKPAASYASKVIASNPSNYWKLDETSGTVAVDSVAGVNGTISGGVTLNQAGAVSGGKAMLFNGTTGNIVTPSTSLTVPYSLELWIKTTSSDKPFFSTRNPPDALQRQIVVRLTTGMLEIFLNFDGQCIGSRVINNGQWHYIVVVFNGAICSAYIDGTDEILSPTALGSAYSPVPHPIEIGYDSTAPDFWNGSIDEVAIYPRALTPAEVLAHYQAR
jgi:hypothetical protein